VLADGAIKRIGESAKAIETKGTVADIEVLECLPCSPFAQPTEFMTDSFQSLALSPFPTGNSSGYHVLS
jgi:hypothetical protein